MEASPRAQRRAPPEAVAVPVAVRSYLCTRFYLCSHTLAWFFVVPRRNSQTSRTGPIADPAGPVAEDKSKRRMTGQDV